MELYIYIYLYIILFIYTANLAPMVFTTFINVPAHHFTPLTPWLNYEHSTQIQSTLTCVNALLSGKPFHPCVSADGEELPFLILATVKPPGQDSLTSNIANGTNWHSLSYQKSANTVFHLWQITVTPLCHPVACQKL